MKYQNGVLLASILLLSQVSIGSERQTLKACGHHDYAPWNWLEGDKIVGVCAEVATQLFGDLGYKVDLTYVGPWKRCQQLIEQGDVDLNICSFINLERKNYSVFSKTPMASNENALFVNKERYFDYTGPESLNAKFIGLVHGVSLGSNLDHHLQKNSYVIRVANHQSLFSMLALQRIDAVIVGRQSGQHLLNLYNLNTQIVDVPTPLLTGNLFFSMSKKSPYIGLLNDIEKVLTSEQYRVWLSSLLERYSFKHKAFVHRNAVVDKTLEVKPKN
ncbi:transporter substrate-binding domain-containing protein [Paraglaciecola sp. 20A4]|uniref:substrate-binding periplasmic protein n=1 Tax=Paraglaciecola sp. 20A4 TaxID=2687288 RepID=UPI001F0E0579|nr:transporter substrate-binding domain-containing protein [Paraglaciecola sp. 20A4]